MEFTAQHEAPDAFHFWTGVSTLAGALRKKVYFDQIYYRWSPNFYVILVAPPGVSTKSTAAGIGMDLLREIQGVKFGANALTWQALAVDLAAAAEAVEMDDGMYHTHCCLTFCASELGSLLDPQDRKMLDVLVDLWDGKSWEKATKGSGRDQIPNPWVNILAGTTPIWLADNMPRVIIGGGFTSRCVFVYADSKRRLVAYPRSQLDFTGTMELREALIHDLELVSMMKGEFILTEEAIEWGTRWYEDNHKNPSKHVAGDTQFSGYINRKQSHAHKLAMVLAASKGDKLIIDRDTLAGAVSILTALECGLPYVFRALNTTESQGKMMDIVEKVKTVPGGRILESALYRIFSTRMSLKEYQEAISSALVAGHVKRDQFGMAVYISAGGTKEEQP